MGATLVPIAVAPTWRKCSPLNLKLFMVSTMFKSWQRLVLVGVCCGMFFLCCISSLAVALRPPRLGRLVYSEPTSSVHRMVLSANLGKSLRMLRKWEVSLKYDFGGVWVWGKCPQTLRFFLWGSYWQKQWGDPV